MQSIIEREATFENNSDIEVKATQKKWSRAFLWKKHNEARHAQRSNPLDKPSTERESLLEANAQLPMRICVPNS